MDLERIVVYYFLSSVGWIVELVRSQSHVWPSDKLDSLAPRQSLSGPINFVVSWSMTTPLMLTCHCSQNRASQYEWLRNWRRGTTQNEYPNDGGHQYLLSIIIITNIYGAHNFPGILLKTLRTLSYLSSLKILRRRYHYYLLFTDEKARI